MLRVGTVHEIPNIDHEQLQGKAVAGALEGLDLEFTPPCLSDVLWRYMDFTKFVLMLHTRSLYFASANDFEDPYEGTWPNTMTDELEGVPIPGHPVHRVFINCWTRLKYESEALWKIYCPEGQGVAIKTDAKSLLYSFMDTIPGVLATICYLDYERGKMRVDSIAPYVHKRRSFEYEQEVRAIVLTDAWDDMQNNRDSHCRTYNVDLTMLIKKIVVHPQALPGLVDAVKSMLSHYSLDIPVEQSQRSPGLRPTIDWEFEP